MRTDAEVEVYAIHSHKHRRMEKTLSDSPAISIQHGLSHSYDGSHSYNGSHRQAGTLFGSKRAYNDSSDSVAVNQDYPQSSKLDNHAELVPIKKENELGYFSTMSVAFSENEHRIYP